MLLHWLPHSVNLAWDQLKLSANVSIVSHQRKKKSQMFLNLEIDYRLSLARMTELYILLSDFLFIVMV